MKEPDQFELFKSLPGVKSKRFRSASGSELPYWPLPSKKYRVQLSDGALIDITKQSPGRSGHPRLYTKMPGSAPDEFVQARNLQAILAQIALLDHIRALNRSIQIKLKQQDDAARALSDLTKDENARLLAELESLRAAEAELEAENARLLAELESVRNQKPARWVNTAAVEWALEQELPTAIKLVLVTFAACADEDRESWPAVKNIAKKSKMAPETVRTAIGFLVASGLLIDTGKKGGETRQVTIYRLPGTDVKGVAVTPPLKGPAKGHQRGTKGVAAATPNNEQGTKEQNADEFKTLSNSIPAAPSNASTSSPFVEGHLKPREHPKWSEYVKWCESQKGKLGKGGRVHDGVANEKGFPTWLSKQKPPSGDRVATTERRNRLLNEMEEGRRIVDEQNRNGVKQPEKKPPSTKSPIPQQSDEWFEKNRALAKQMKAAFLKQLEGTPEEKRKRQ